MYSCDNGGVLIQSEGQAFCVDIQRALLFKNRTASKRTKKTFFLSLKICHINIFTFRIGLDHKVKYIKAFDQPLMYYNDTI